MRTAQDVVLNIVWALCNVCETSIKSLCKHLRICPKMTSEVTAIPLRVLTFRNTIFKSLSKIISTSFGFVFGQRFGQILHFSLNKHKEQCLTIFSKMFPHFISPAKSFDTLPCLNLNNKGSTIDRNVTS